MDRRALLRGLGLGTLTLAGCTSSRPEVALASVTVVNSRHRSTEVEVTIDESGETRYRETHVVPGQETARNAVEITEDWMGERVPYSVAVGVVDGSATEAYSTGDAEADVSDWGANTCFDTLFTVDPSRIRVAVGAQESC